MVGIVENGMDFTPLDSILTRAKMESICATITTLIPQTKEGNEEAHALWKGRPFH